MISPIRRRAAVVLMVLGLALGIPLGALASHQFADVPNSNIFHNDISALAASGVTTGCGGGNFCPSDYVTREQMAAFMNRLGSLDGVAVPSVNATKLDGYDASNFLQTGTVVTSVDGSAWNAHVFSPTTVSRFVTEVDASGDGSMVLALVAPSQFSGVTYGLASLQICYGASGGGYINSISVYRTDSTGGDSVPFSDGTDRTTSGCYSVGPNVAVGEGLGIYAVLSGGGSVALRNVKATWSSSGTFSFEELPASDPAISGGQ